jgi:xylulokinase
VPAVLETAVAGSAILAATGIGAWPDLLAAIRGMTRVQRRISPRAEHRKLYDRTFDAYRRLYPAIAPIVRDLAETGS